MSRATLIKENNHFIGVACSFRGIVHYHYGVIGGVQADMVLGKELKSPTS